MANEVFGETDFLWSIPTAGYQWIQAKMFVSRGGGDPANLVGDSRPEDKPRWALMVRNDTGGAYEVRQYRPLRMFTGLFRSFAEAPPTREGILSFANTYGNLGITRHWVLPTDGPRQPMCWGESLDDWVAQMKNMRRAVELWDMIRKNDGSSLRTLLRWKPEQPDMGVDGWEYSAETDFAIPIEPPQGVLFKPDDVVTPAFILIDRWTNKALETAAAPRLLYNPARGKPSLRLFPKHLLGALWLQFAQAVDGEKEYRACKECGKYFEISLDEDGFRTNRLFCSDSCKSKEYRGRRNRALQMRAEGRAVKAIAKELETDVETIKKWVARRKG